MASDAEDESLTKRYRAATNCRKCFEAGYLGLTSPSVDVAQPRWIGPNYWSAKPRIVFVLLNPGAGSAQHEEGNLRARELIVRFRDAHATLDEVFIYQRKHMPFWGTPAGRFLKFYTTGLGLNLDDIAFHNIALCATAANQYPAWMLRRCFETHSGAILKRLDPHIVALSGSGTWGFEPEVKALLPSASVIRMLHYAHRKGSAAEVVELTRVRELLAAQS